MLLEANDLEVGYQEKQVIFGASVRVDAGEFVGLIGHNGAGKTTLLKTLCGFLNPMAGRVTYKGEDITGKSPAVNVRKGICFVHQEKALFPNLTVLENLEL
ncbi:MAG TPA: ATP-binding cassette domain-containing protein, partial [Thermodesulfobacteriota bacterium]|nr:ATP-binding cassette domain-containing protein [Thermodesulfobacteriota bacterium]